MARRLAALPLLLALLALPVRPSQADVVVTLPPEPAVAACQARQVGDRCLVRGRPGICLTRIERRASSGGLFDRDSTELVCVRDREITDPMRACIGRREWDACTLGEVPGRCQLVDRLLQCLPSG
jgi:hypothetical protein